MKEKLKVLFVSSGNSKIFEITPFIKSQGESLQNNGVDVEYFLVKGKGFRGYWRAAKELKKELEKKKFNIIHAHYSLCALTAILARPKTPIVVSLMGSDVLGEHIGKNKVKFSNYYLRFIIFFIQPFVDAIISKSKNIENHIYLKKKSSIIPNGVNTDLFKNLKDKKEMRKELGLSQNKKLILFFGNTTDKNKNFSLVNDAVNLLADESVEIVAPYPLSPDLVPKYYQACDVFVLASFMEGSPNVIKEAMSSNCPIVSTDVGDTKWVFGNTEGCFISDFSKENYSQKLMFALEFSAKNNRTKGMDRITELGIDINSIAKRIIELYTRLARN